MQTDNHQSIPDRNYEYEMEKLKALYGEYQAKYLLRLKKLDRCSEFVNDNTYHGIRSDHHIMYKLKCDKEGNTLLMSKDGHRAYEFLIEFDTQDTAYGIYYGCRSLIKDGDQDKEISVLQSEWDNILMAETCNVLNNTFIDKDFSGRFQKTNNANNRTYWPFWIALQEDEDVVDVAARAVSIMYRIYKRFLIEGIVPSPRAVYKKVAVTRVNFTQSAYASVLKEIKADCDSMGCDYKKAVDTLKLFIKNGVKENKYGRPGLVEDFRYEKCWKFFRIPISKAAHVLAELSRRMGLTLNSVKGEIIPWKYFSGLFLSKDDEPMNSLKQSYKQSSKSNREWAEQYLDDILNPIKIY
jgi:hypothetical protein